jgi:hypothetical protein
VNLAPRQCPRCRAELRARHVGWCLWTVVCPDCYDGTEDSPAVSRVMGRGDTVEQATTDFHERLDEARS